LRKSILTLAVQGKLVPQGPNDEPAEELIARIATMRHAKKAKQYEPVDSDAVPFDAPYSWSWVRLGNLSLSSDSGWSPQCASESRSGSEWGVLKVSAVSWGGFDPEANKALPSGMEARPECEVRPGDFLLSRANTEELVARSVVVDQTPPRLMMSDKIVRFTFPDEIEKVFINLANLSDSSREYYMRNASGTSSSMKNIGREVMCNLPIALPPLAEQRRIVAKVSELMALVDELETQLAASRADAEKLLSALVAELTGTTSRLPADS
jgi:type I restriction enzyme S subunit